MTSNVIPEKTVPYMWIAFYNDGTCLPQFDPDIGQQHFFKEVDQNRIDKFGLFPIPQRLADKLGGQYYSNPLLPHHILRLKPNQRLIGGIRRESQSMFKYSKCLKCGFEWQWMVGKEDGSIGDSGLQRFGSEKYYYSLKQPNGKITYEVICPKCGVRNDLDCPDCHKQWNKIEDEETKQLSRDKKKYYIECSQCKKRKEWRTLYLDGQAMREIYLLGWQQTIPDGTNKKMIMFIFNDGTFELSDDFNAI